MMNYSKESKLREEDLKAFQNFKQNLNKYLLHTIMATNQISQFAKSSPKAEHSQAKKENSIFVNIDELVPFFLDECQQNFLPVDPSFVTYYLHLLIRDSRDGLDLNLPSQDASIGKLEKFLFNALSKYQNRKDATVNCMKVSYFCKNTQELSLEFVKEKYQIEFENKLTKLIDNILQYPETSNGKQLEELFIKMQIFIITNYQIGYPENHVLLKQCRQALNSILGKGDLQKYVLRKKYHRLEYLRKLGATVAGILIFNNQGDEAEKQNVRNIFDDLKMAICNTKDSLQEGCERVSHLKQNGFDVMLKLFEFNFEAKNIVYLRPQIQIFEINKFLVLFEVYRRKLKSLKDVFEKTEYLIEVNRKKFDCVIEKINKILKHRSAIESEFIFPHFVYLSEIWNSSVLYIYHLVEINRLKDHLDNMLGEELETEFNEMLKDLADERQYLKHPLEYSFEEAINSTAKREIIINIKPFVKDYCALTFALTGGLLVPSKLDKKLSEDVNFRFGFSHIEYAKFADRNFREFSKAFYNTLLTNSDLIVLFELDDEVIKQDLNLIKNLQTVTKSIDTQTEMLINADPSPKPRLNETWNIWEFYRETIRLANIRKKQTHSVQSNLSFGTRNAQNQCDRKAYSAVRN